MTWFKIDDRYSLHPKARAAGKNGRALWYAAGEGCARENLEGVVPAHMLPLYGSLAEVPHKRAANLLVAAGLWHHHDGLCGRCEDARETRRVALAADGRELTPLGPGDFYFHDWNDYQLDKDGKDDPIARRRSARWRALYRTEAGKAIIAAVRERDQDQCRYCGELTVWSVGRGGDTRSPLAGTVDHLDPFEWSNTVAGLVVACRQHNGQKRDRTPEQWVADGGLPLMPPPVPYQRPDFGRSSETTSRTGGSSSRDARGGPGTGRAAGSGQDGHRPISDEPETGLEEAS